MIPKYAPADLGLLSIAPQSGIVKNTKFDHVLDTIFCAFWTESVHRALPYIFCNKCSSIIKVQDKN